VSGDLDPSFSEDGIILRDFFGFDDGAVAVTTSRGGTVLVGGSAGRDAYGDKTDEVVLRHRDDGSLDPGFGRAGVVRSPLGALADIVELSDAKLLLVGSAKGSAAVARLLPDGTLDPTWGRNGLSVISRRALGGDDCISATTAAVMKDRRIVVGGRVGCGGENGHPAGVFAARLRPNGALDQRFARHGAWVSHSSCDLIGVAVQRTGKLLVGGSTGSSDYCTYGSMLLTSLRPNGAPDTSFATKGRLRVRFPGARHSEATALQVDRRGRPVLVGTAGNRFAVARVLPDGRPDRSFSGDGRVRSRGRGEDYATGVAIEANGRMTISGADGRGDNARFVVLRFQANGSPDRSFGAKGIRTISFGSDVERAGDVALDAQGRAVVVGFARSKQTDGDFAIARLR